MWLHRSYPLRWVRAPLIRRSEVSRLVQSLCDRRSSTPTSFGVVMASTICLEQRICLKSFHTLVSMVGQ